MQSNDTVEFGRAPAVVSPTPLFAYLENNDTRVESEKVDLLQIKIKQPRPKATPITKAWKTSVTQGIRMLPPGEYTVDTIREALEPSLGCPNNCNAWGGVIRGMLGKGVLEFTGKRIKTTRKTARGRRIHVYLKRV